MKIVIAFDSFKGSLAAREACRVAAERIRCDAPAWTVVVKPMADGGEGTAATLLDARPGEWIPKRVMGPLPDRTVEAGYAWFEDRLEAVVEMAVASGLPLLHTDERNPLRTTTYGTGQLLRAAIERGAQRILLAAGGSATVDGGVGVAMAMGWKVLDHDGQPVELGGGELERIASIAPPPDLARWPEIRVLCDVDNPLCGEHGAAAVFGPQKGATPDMVERLDAGLSHLADVVRASLGRDVRDVPGAGAAGGLAAGAMAFANAVLTPGVDALMEAAGLPEALQGADWVLTGEGLFDAQSTRGKVVSGVAREARRAGARVAVIAGDLRADEAVRRAVGVDMAFALRGPGMSVEDAMARAVALLDERVGEWVDAVRGEATV